MAEAQKGIQATLFDYLQDTECLFVDNRTDTRYNRDIWRCMLCHCKHYLMLAVFLSIGCQK